MKKILVPTDFSSNSKKAIHYAAEIAAASGADICIVHILDIAAAVMSEAIVMQGSLDREMIADAEKKLEELVESTKQVTHGKVASKMVTGLVVDGILEAARENDADMIILGTLGDTALQEKIFGSITAKVIGRADIPVLAVPLQYEWEQPESILLALNNFKEDPSIMDTLIYVAKLFNTPIKVAIFTNDKNSQAVDYLQNKRDVDLFCNNMQHEHPELKIESHPLYGTHFEEAIKTYVKTDKTSLLVMLNHKRNFLESLFHRSMTKKMSYHTDIPLLSLPVH